MSKRAKDGGKNAITVDEKSDYDRLRKYINANKDTFYAVGTALAEVSERKLYRADYKTFEAYCEGEHQFTSNYARRLIGFVKVVKSVPIGTLPANEAQARELAKAKPEQRVKAMEAAKEASGGKPTAVHVRRAVEQVTDTPSAQLKARADLAKLNKTDQPPAPTDENDRPLPDRVDVREAFENAGRLREALPLLAQISGIINQIAGDAEKQKPVPGGSRLAHISQEVRRDIRNIRAAIKASVPFAVCPYCDAKREKCNACKGEGWVPEGAYDSAPPEMKGKAA